MVIAETLKLGGHHFLYEASVRMNRKRRFTKKGIKDPQKRDGTGNTNWLSVICTGVKKSRGISGKPCACF